jgi:hypothetical protein
MGKISDVNSLLKGASSSILCHLASYDVYTLLQPLKISPTPYVFAIRAQDRASIFEKEDDYIRFVAAEDQEVMKKWVLSIRCAKVKHEQDKLVYNNRYYRILFIINIIRTG